MIKDETTEKRILEAAKEIFLEKGFDGARMQEIADSAKINKAMLHYYFRSKDKLFARIFEEIMENNIPQMTELVSPNASLEEIIRKFVDAYITLLQKNPFAPMFLLHELSRKSDLVAEIVEKFLKPRFSVVLIALQHKLKEHKVDPRMLFINIIALCIFPFISKPIMKNVFEFSEEEYSQMIEKRKVLVPEIIINSLK